MKRIHQSMRAASLLICFAAAAGSARAQDAADPRLDRVTAKSVNALLDSARSERLPVKPLTGVMQEGISRRADGARIAKAMQDYLHALRASLAALGAASSEEEIVSGAGAVLAGVPASSLTKIRAARGKEPVVVALVVLGDLVARGLPPDAAGSAIVSATKSGFHDADLLAFRQRVEQDLAAGSTAATALESGLRRMQARPMSTDSVVQPRVKPPEYLRDESRLDLRQAAGPFERSLVDVSGAGGFSSTGRSPIDVNANFHVLDITRAREGALFEGGVLGTIGSRFTGASVGAGMLAVSTGAGAWARPSVLANAWTEIAGVSLQLRAALRTIPATFFDAKPAASPLTLQLLKPMRALVVVDTPLAHPPVANTPDNTTPVDSSSGKAGDFTASEVSLTMGRQFLGMRFSGTFGMHLTATRGAASWSALSVSRPLIDGVAMTVGGSAGPEDYLSPGGGTRFFAGLRLAPRRAAVPALEKSGVGTASAFRATPSLGGTMLEVRIADAKIVELTGDFSNWEPIALQASSNGLWTLLIPMDAGIHRVRLRVDGGDWSPPPGLPRAPDPFGGEVGLLRIGAS